jgi:hypothetical protein
MARATTEDCLPARPLRPGSKNKPVLAIDELSRTPGFLVRQPAADSKARSGS